MNLVKKQFNIKLFLFVMSMTCIIAIFWVNQILIKQLRNEARSQVEFLAKSYSDAINSNNQEDIRFVIDILLPSMHFPILITTKDEISAVLNFKIKADKGGEEYNKIAWEKVREMDKTFSPLDLIWNNIKWGEIHYSDPKVVSHLRWIPYMEIGFGIIFISITLWGLQLIRRSEKNYIYAGMARETAHQLGTPVSSLMGWIKILRETDDKSLQIIDAMEEDTLRLSEITERFSKIGSSPKLKTISINKLISESTIYMRNRLPKKSRITIKFIVLKKIEIKGDWVLLRWAIENLLKNAVDAIKTGPGSISILVSKDKNSIQIDIKDTGKGINRVNWKNIFRPGYSTKYRGWGLGLSLTQRIIEEIHRGKIKVLSSKPGETIFRLNFFL